MDIEGCHIEDEDCLIEDEDCLIEDEDCLIEDEDCLIDEDCPNIEVDCLYNVPYTPDITKLKEDFLKELKKISEDWKELVEKTEESAADRSMMVYKAGEFLLIAFEAGVYNAVFSEVEKCSIVTLLLDAVKAIQMYARFYFFCRSMSRLEGYILQNRSAIEFLSELCKSSKQCKGFNEVLETLKNCASILNTIIENSRDLLDLDMGPGDLKIFGASKVPTTHTWWPK